jgi:glucokinase
MTAVASAHRTTGASTSSRPFLVGVEVGHALIRAGVFSETFELIGKAKVSTKKDRGTAAVLERIARCVEYAADECDLEVEEMRGLGVGVPGNVNARSGLALSAASLGWKDVPVRNALEKLLRVPVFVENHFRLSTLGVFAGEIDFPVRRLAVLFLGPEIGGAFIVDGELVETDALSSEGLRARPGADSIFATMPQQEFRHSQVRDLRKAIRKGNLPVREFARAIATKAGEVSAQLVKEFDPEVIVLGGGLMEEMRDEALQIVEQVVFGEKAGRDAKVRFLPSTLGDLAGIIGGATLAANKLVAVD